MGNCDGMAKGSRMAPQRKSVGTELIDMPTMSEDVDD
jgi:hypothetical protein